MKKQIIFKCPACGLSGFTHKGLINHIAQNRRLHTLDEVVEKYYDFMIEFLCDKDWKRIEG